MPSSIIKEKIQSIYEQPFIQLLADAITTHLKHFSANEMELCALLSVKTGTCPEDCAYCPQSGHYKTGLEKEKLLPLDEVIKAATLAKSNGATRFCMGAAWRNPPKKEFPQILAMIEAVKSLGMETCVTLGMLESEQAEQLKASGLDFYNHNLDTSPDYYKKIITTRTYQDRLDTLAHVRHAGISVCCGGIIGMGETRDDRIAFLTQLANLPASPRSIPINRLLAIKGTPLENTEPLDNIEFIRTIATTRILFPQSVIRLSAGRVSMSEEMQMLCFAAGANSLWLGDKLLTTSNSDSNQDKLFLQRLGVNLEL